MAFRLFILGTDCFYNEIRPSTIAATRENSLEAFHSYSGDTLSTLFDLMTPADANKSLVIHSHDRIDRRQGRLYPSVVHGYKDQPTLEGLQHKPEQVLFDGVVTDGADRGQLIASALLCLLTKIIVDGETEIDLYGFSRGAVCGMMLGHELERVLKALRGDPHQDLRTLLLDSGDPVFQAAMEHVAHHNFRTLHRLQSQLLESEQSALAAQIEQVRIDAQLDEPVPGGRLHGIPTRWADPRFYQLSALFRNVTINLAENEWSRGFKAVIPKVADNSESCITLRGYPGNHAILAGGLMGQGGETIVEPSEHEKYNALLSIARLNMMDKLDLALSKGTACSVSHIIDSPHAPWIARYLSLTAEHRLAMRLSHYDLLAKHKQALVTEFEKYAYPGGQEEYRNNPVTYVRPLVLGPWAWSQARIVHYHSGDNFTLNTIPGLVAPNQHFVNAHHFNLIMQEVFKIPCLLNGVSSLQARSEVFLDLLRRVESGKLAVMKESFGQKAFNEASRAFIQGLTKCLLQLEDDESMHQACNWLFEQLSKFKETGCSSLIADFIDQLPNIMAQTLISIVAEQTEVVEHLEESGEAGSDEAQVELSHQLKRLQELERHLRVRDLVDCAPGALGQNYFLPVRQAQQQAAISLMSYVDGLSEDGDNESQKEGKGLTVNEELSGIEPIESQRRLVDAGPSTVESLLYQLLDYHDEMKTRCEEEGEGCSCFFFLWGFDRDKHEHKRDGSVYFYDLLMQRELSAEQAKQKALEKYPRMFEGLVSHRLENLLDDIVKKHKSAQISPNMSTESLPLVEKKKRVSGT